MPEPLLLLPGMMCDGRLFGPQVASLGSERAIQLGCITRGSSVEAIASEVLADAPPSFALAGLSMGGIVAMEIMAQAPERVTRLALLDTNPRAEKPEVAAARAPMMAKVEAGGLAEVMREEMKPNYLAPGPQRADVLDLVLEMALDLGSDVFIRQSLALRDRPDQQETLKSVRVPSLVLMGEHDALCPLDRHELMRDLIPGSQFVVVPGAGHLPPLEQPEAVNYALGEWLTA